MMSLQARDSSKTDEYIEELTRPLSSKRGPFWSRVAQEDPDSKRRQDSVVSLAEDVNLVV